MAKVEIVPLSELPPSDRGTWRRLQDLTPAFRNPLLGPDFAEAVAEGRPDARVAIWREAGRAVAFLAHHRRPGGLARPIGAPFSDYHALISEPGTFAGPLALRQAGVGALRMTGLVDPHGIFGAALRTTPAYRIDLSGGVEAYFDDLRARSGNRWRNYRRYSRRLAAALGPLRIVAHDPSPEAFAALLAWKRNQLVRTGLHDFTAVPWVSDLLVRLFERREAGFGGMQISLYAGERLVAGHFGVRQDGHYHPWLGAYDPELASFSPGLVHQIQAVAAAGDAGVTVYDLGPGAGPSKTMFANAESELRTGLAVAASLGGRWAGAHERLWEGPAGRFPLVGRLRNRMDQIAALELTLGGRLGGLARAAAAMDRRIAAPPAAARG